MADFIVTKAKIYHKNGDTLIVKPERMVSDIEIVRSELHSEYSPKRVELTYTQVTDEPK